MPIGVLINALSVVIGGLIGLTVKNRLDLDFKEKLNMIFGVCAMGMGISSVMLMKNMPAVIFSIVIGTAIGLAIHLGDRIQRGAGLMQRVASKIVKQKDTSISEEEFMTTLVTVIVLFCASGTGIYGSIVSGMTADCKVCAGSVYSYDFCLHAGRCGISDRNSAGGYFPGIVFVCRIALSADYTGDDR